MEYRLNKDKLLEELAIWNGLLKRRVRLIACGGTALTLLGIKPSTKDVDLIIPEISEYDYLTKLLKDLGYKPVTGVGLSRDGIFIFDLFRATSVDVNDCLLLFKAKRNEIDTDKFISRFRVTASFDVSEISVLKNLEYFLSVLKKEGLYNEKR